MNITENQSDSEKLAVTQRTKVKRLPQRSNYERQMIYDILDEGLVCQVGFAIDQQPFVIPTAYGRVDDRLYIHGSPASRMLRSLQAGIPVCVTVTLLDGLVLARSAFHHSMNYRSVVLFGTATIVEDPDQKMEALRAFTEHVMPNRWTEVRHPSPAELNGTLVLSLPIEEASAKVRTGPPIDDAADHELSVWAGVLPLRLVTGTAIADPQLRSGIAVPSYVTEYERGGGE